MNSLYSKSQNSEFEFSEICTFGFVFWLYGKTLVPPDWIQVMHFWQEYQRSDAVFFSASCHIAPDVSLSHY